MSHRTRVALRLAAALTCLALWPLTASAQTSVVVDDIGLQTGFQGTWFGEHRRGRATIAADFNLDGRPDFYIGNPGDRSFVILNTEGPGGQTEFVLVQTLLVGELTWGGAAADYDNDGDYDLFISIGGNEGIGLDYLFRNLWLENGETAVSFEDVSVAAGVQGPIDPGSGLPVPMPSANATWTDYDNDGDPDLFVNGNLEQYSLPQFLGRNTLWRNDANGTFTDVTRQSRLDSSLRPTRHSTFLDIDNDGDVDLFESNFIESNVLWLNRLVETGSARFDDVTTQFSPPGEDLRYPDQAFASTAADLNNDGWLDLIVFMRGPGPESGSPYQVGHALFVNNGGTGFTNIAGAAALNVNYEDGLGVMGCQVGDVNGDGTPDIYVGTGGPPTGNFDQLYLSDNTDPATPHYRDFSSAIDFPAPEESGFPLAYPSYPYRTHGTSMVDVTGDGRLEIAVACGGPVALADTVREPNRLFAFTITPEPGFFKVRPRGDGVSVSRDAIDTRLALTVRTAGGPPRTLHRVLLGGNAFSAQKGFEVHFYTGDADTVDALEIRWPDGVIETLGGGLSIGQSITVERDGAAGSIGPTLSVADDPGGLALSWAPSCSSGASDYAVYRGELGEFTSHVPALCSSGGATSAVIPDGTGSEYYLVVPLDGASEGSYGRDGDGTQRAPAAAACAARRVGACS